MKKCGMKNILISLDTNIWIFGITGLNPFCERILLNLSQFEVIIPNRIRGEIERNLSSGIITKTIEVTVEQADGIYLPIIMK